MKKNLKFVLDNYKIKDRNSESYYFTVKAYDKEGNEVLLLSHLNNKTATGWETLDEVAKMARSEFDEIHVEEYRAFSQGTTGALEPIQTHIVTIKKDKPAVRNQQLSGVNDQVFGIFGGLEGFVQFTREQSSAAGKMDSLKDRITDLMNEKGVLMIKLGNEEQANRELKKEISDLEKKLRDTRWELEDSERKLRQEHEDYRRNTLQSHEDELRKYKGQHAIISAGVQGLGSLIAKKLNVSGNDIAGLLGVEGQTNEQPQSGVDSGIKQKADEIYNWLLQTDTAVMDKVYVAFSYISSDESNLNNVVKTAQKSMNKKTEIDL